MKKCLFMAVCFCLAATLAMAGELEDKQAKLQLLDMEWRYMQERSKNLQNEAVELQKQIQALQVKKPEVKKPEGAPAPAPAVVEPEKAKKK
jgi:FtsZ-binding cell division protein ZapB